MRVVRLPLLACVLICASLAVIPIAAGAETDDPFSEAWSHELSGWNRSSSPVIADIDGDGENEIAFGHQDGTLRVYEGDGTLAWSAQAVPEWGPDAAASRRHPRSIRARPLPTSTVTGRLR